MHRIFYKSMGGPLKSVNNNILYKLSQRVIPSDFLRNDDFEESLNV